MENYWQNLLKKIISNENKTKTKTKQNQMEIVLNLIILN